MFAPLIQDLELKENRQDIVITQEVILQVCLYKQTVGQTLKQQTVFSVGTAANQMVIETVN